MHAVLDGVSRDQFMARHKANYVPDPRPGRPATARNATGSGDNVVACLVAGLLRGHDLTGCLQLVAATAAVGVAAAGATAGAHGYALLHASQLLSRLDGKDGGDPGISGARAL